MIIFSCLILWNVAAIIAATEDVTFELTKSVDNTTPEINQSFTYTLFYRCASLIDTHCTDMVVTDQLSDDLEFVSATAGAHPATVTELDNLVTFTFDDPVPAGSTGQLAITVRIPLHAGVNNGDVIPNMATIDASNASGPLDSNPVNVTATVGTEPVHYDKYGGSTTAAVDTDFEYTLVIDPISAPVTNATIVDTLPPGSVYVSCSGGDSCTYDSTNHQVTWTDASITGWNAYQVILQFPSGTFSNDDLIVNNADFDFTDGGTPVSVSTSENTTIAPAAPVIDVKKWGYVGSDIWGSKDVEIGEEAGYPYGINSAGTADLTNIVVTDIFPTEFDFTRIQTPRFNSPYPTGLVLYYELNSSGTWVQFPASAYDNGTGADPSTDEVVTLADLGISGSDKVTGFRVEIATIEIGAGTSNGEHGIVYGTINTSAIGSPTVENCISGTADGSDPDSHCASVNITVHDVAALDSYKWVKGLDELGFVNPINGDACEDNGQGYTRYPCVAQTVQGGIADYQLVLENPGTITMTDIALIDILPFIGDTGVLVTDLRNTEWTPNLAGPVTAPAGVTVYYSTSTNPCRGEVGGPTTGCDTPNWSTIPPADITTVGSLKFDFGTIEIGPGEQFILAWPMRVPNGTPTDEVAWNSFAYVASRADNGVELLPSEPPKVGIITSADIPNTYGDYIWLDTDRDGIQDGGEVGINGVQIDLYSDVNGTPNDFTDDLHMGFTVSGNDGSGNPGYYLFPNLPDGDYYAVATPPAVYAISLVDASGDGGANDTTDAEDDSDFDPTTLRTPITNLGPRDIPLAEEIDLSWDLGVYLLGPSIQLEKTVYTGHDSGAGCPGVELVQASTGADVTYCFVITNNGETDLDDLTFIDATLGITGADVVSPIITSTVLAQGNSMTVYYETASLGTITNTATVDGRPVDGNGDPILDPDTSLPIDRPTDEDTAATEEIAMVLIGDLVWIEDDNDGSAETGVITPVVGSLVTAIASDGTTYTDTTDANGLYTITVPANATYTVTVNTPSGMLPSGTLITSDSDPNSDDNLSHDGSGTVVTVGAEDNLTIDFGFYEPILAASHTPICPAGALLWVNNIDVNNLQGSHGAPATDVRFVGRNVVSYTLPITLPAAFSGPIDIDISEAVAWDGYMTRATTGDQPNERYAVLFMKNGNLEWQSAWTGVDGTDDGIATGVTFDDWTGSLGTASLPNGADEIILIHWGEPTYGNNDTSPNSVVPCSVCIEYSIPAPTDVILGDRVWIEDDNDGLATTGVITPVVGTVVTAIGSDGTVYTDSTDAMGYYTITVPANDVYTVTVGTPAGTTVAVPMGGLVATDNDPAADDDTSHDPAGTVVTVGTEDNLTIDFGFHELPSGTPSLAMTKMLNTPEPVNVGQPINFTIRITNTGDVTITTLPLMDTYDTTYLTYDSVNGSTPATDSNSNDGQLEWSDLTETEGDLAPGDTIEVIVYFTAVADTSALAAQSPCVNGGESCNVAAVNNAMAGPDPVPPVEDSDDVTIEELITGKSTLGDFVWYDTNGDGIKDPGEPGINGVIINLYSNTGLITTTVTMSDVGGVGDDTGVTNGDGFYDFEVLPSTVYTVEIDPSNFDPGGALEGYSYTGNNATMPYNGDETRVVIMPVDQHDENNVDFSYVAPLFELSKVLNTPPPARVNDVVSFTIRITNTGTTVITEVPLMDTHNNGYLSYITASPLPDVPAQGELIWHDLTATGASGFGTDLNPGETFEIVVEFLANLDTTDLPNNSTINLAESQGISDTAEVPIFAPTSVQLSVREVVYKDGNVILRWETADETDVVGFHIYRQLASGDDGEPVQITEELLVAKKSGSSSGTAYTYEDETAQASVDYRYFVGILDTNDLETRSLLGNVSVQRTFNEWHIFLPILLR